MFSKENLNNENVFAKERILAIFSILEIFGDTIPNRLYGLFKLK